MTESIPTPREIAEEFQDMVRYHRENIVINDCDVCHTLFIQKMPYELCDECKEITRDIF